MKHKSTVASPLGNEHFNLDSTLDLQAHSQTFREQSQESSLPGTDYEIAPSKKNRAVHNQSSNFSNLKLSHSHQQELCSPSSPLNSQSSRFPPTSPSKVPSSAPQLPHHHHSPSTIAQFILKSASSGLASRSLETLDMEQVAAKNDDTAEALRKLDGLSTISVSPKVSRHLVKEYGVLANHASSGSNPGTVIQSRRSTASRPSSTSSSTGKERVSIKDRHKVSDDQVSVSSKKSRSRSIASAKESVSAVASQTEDYSVADQIAEMACQQSPAVARRLSFKLPQASTVGLPSTTYSSFSTHSSSKGVEGSGSSSSSPKTFYNSTTTSGSNGGVSRRASHSKQGPQPVQVEPNSVIGVSSFSGGPSDTSNAAFLNTGKRGSSSSTNYTGGTQSTGTTLDSRDSSLATSVSATASLPHHQVNYSSANGQITTNRSSNTSKSRNSAGSEASLVFSAGLNEQGRNNESSNLGPSKCESGEGMHIPPVPPLPKDYEPYKASNYGSSQIQYPPHSTSQIKNSSTKADNQPPDSHLLLKVNTATSTLNLASSNPSSPPGGLVATSSSSTSATSRFLHSLSSHKTSEDSINSSATHITNSGSGTSVSSKSTKKWSLSAALGIGKVPSFTKDNSHEEGARLPSAISSVSNQRFECRVSSSGSKKDFVDEVNANESNQNYSMGSQASKHSPLVSTTIQSPLHSHPASPVLTEKLTLNTSSSSVSTGETRASALPTNKSGLGSALSSRRTPSGIPFFSRKSSANNSGVAPGKLSISQPLACDESQSSSSFKIKSPRLLEKGDGEGGGRKSILALNAFIRNSVQRKPNLPSQTKEASSIPASSSFSSHVKVNQSPQSARNSEKSSIDKTSGTSHHRKKLSINLSHGGGGCKEPFAETNSPVKKHTFGTKASSLITRKRGKFTKDSLLPPLPPLQMSAIHPTTTQRFESTSSLHAYNSSPSNPPKRQSGDFTHSASFSTRGTRVRTLRESTTSLRKAMPTIDASPHGKNARDEPVKQSTSLQHFDSNTDLRKSQVSKENISVHQVSDTTDTPILSRVSPRQTNPPCSVTPTKIPRAVFRSQKNTSPALKSRISDNHLSLKSDINLTPNGSKDLLSPAKEGQDESMLEDFGILSTRTSSLQCSAVNKRGPEAATGLGNSMIPRTRSRGSISGKPVQRASNNDLKVDSSFHIKDSSTAMTNEEQNQAQRSRNHGSLTIHGSPSSALSAAARLAAARRTVARTQESQAARVSSRRQSTHSTIHPSSNLADQSGVSEFGASETSGLQSSRSSRTLGSKLNLPSRISRSSTTSSVIGLMETNVAPTASRLSSAHDNQSPSSLRGRSPQMSDEETKGDEEMKQYVTRQRNKKLMSGMTSSEIDKLFEFPKAIEPVKAMTNQEALKLYKSYLSDYEKGEILEYQEIYYVGAESEKKMCQGISSTLDPRTGEKIFNYGYDDERGDYQIVKNDHLCFRYEVIDLLGKGSFGQVLECRDHKTGEMVAVKIIRNKKRFHHQALVEIKVLENLLKWDPDDRHCVLKMMDHFSFRGHLCIVNELLSINLYELIRNNSFNGFSVGLIKRFTTQILMSLSLLRHHRVVHCDLKPENILLKHPEKSAIKTIDFGSSCFENEKVYTYIQSRFYRSPDPGETESEQLACIMEVLGMPDKYLVDRSSRRKLFFDSSGAPRPVVNSKGRRRRVGSKTLQSVLKADDELFVDFIAKCLAWDPERRLKPDPAMRHPWILAGRGSSRPSMSTTFSHSSISSRLANRSTTSGISISSPRRKTMQATSNSSCTSGLTQSNSSVILGTNSSISSSIGNTTNSFRLRAQSNAHRQILKNVQPHQSSATSGGAAGDSILRQSLPLKAGP
ncbi:CMGC/DYRK/DYRK2 protein kinase [Phakopsora pachyrhizi]|uniref:dual-specificity kinase n=1 Tax=Phakopsora pachyrhizi TaxID=170000 RepID=A0AAV0BME9_PHAPC|nr:CMGC/DYRK/DYRK2 protein kinase [Phakopsora pachyrhizi]